MKLAVKYYVPLTPAEIACDCGQVPDMALVHTIMLLERANLIVPFNSIPIHRNVEGIKR